jgi:hypothetical protein
MLLLSFKALAIAVAPASPIPMSFECWWKSTKKRKILTAKVKSDDVFVFFQSIGNYSCPCISNLVAF